MWKGNGETDSLSGCMPQKPSEEPINLGPCWALHDVRGCRQRGYQKGVLRTTLTT